MVSSFRSTATLTIELSYRILFLTMPLPSTTITSLQRYYGLLPPEFTNHFLFVRYIGA